MVNHSQKNILFLTEVEKRLSANKSIAARAEAEQLVEHYTRMNRVQLLTGEKKIALTAQKKIEAAIRRRLKGEPLAYILGYRDFAGHRFLVNRHVLIPRLETEILLEEAVRMAKEYYTNRLDGRKTGGGGGAAPWPAQSGHATDKRTWGKPPTGPVFWPSEHLQILDIGTGSGILAACLTLAIPDCRMTALDISGQALKVARTNFRRLGLSRKVKCVQSDLFEALAKPGRLLFDLIVSNPPYIASMDYKGLSREVRSEPKRALVAGSKGLDILKKILSRAPFYMKPGAALLMEIGDGQRAAIERSIENEKFFTKVCFIKDLAGIERVVILKK